MAERTGIQPPQGDLEVPEPGKPYTLLTSLDGLQEPSHIRYPLLRTAPFSIIFIQLPCSLLPLAHDKLPLVAV